MKCEHCSGTMMLSRGNVGEPDVQKCMSCGRTNAPTAAAEVSTSGRMSLSNEEKIMRCIETYGMATRRMLNQRGLTAEEINYIPRTLVSQGKLQAWPTAKDGNFIYTFPGAADPRLADPEKQKNPGNWQRGPRKTESSAEEAPPPAPPQAEATVRLPIVDGDEFAASLGSEPPPNGGGVQRGPRVRRSGGRGRRGASSPPARRGDPPRDLHPRPRGAAHAA